MSQDEAMDGKEMTEISDNEIIHAKPALAENVDNPNEGDPPKEGVEGGDAGTDELDRRMSTDCGSFESANQEEDQEESCLLGIDCNEQSTVGLVLRIYADTKIHLDGDGWVEIVSNKQVKSQGVNRVLFSIVSLQWIQRQCLWKDAHLQASIRAGYVVSRRNLSIQLGNIFAFISRFT